MPEQEAQEQLQSEPVKYQRQPALASAFGALHHMRECSRKESRRGGTDLTSELLLPASSLLLVLAIWFPGPPQVRAAAFLLPLLSLLHYVTLRIGVVKTFNSRQAYLTWHLMIATFLMGGTAALFGVYVIAYLIRLAIGSST